MPGRGRHGLGCPIVRHRDARGRPFRGTPSGKRGGRFRCISLKTKKIGFHPLFVNIISPADVWTAQIPRNRLTRGQRTRLIVGLDREAHPRSHGPVANPEPFLPPNRAAIQGFRWRRPRSVSPGTLSFTRSLGSEDRSQPVNALSQYIL